MPRVNLELQMKFLMELDEALKDALGRYEEEGAEKLAELEYMKKEVGRAQRIISERISRETDDDTQKSYREAAYQEVAYQ